MGLSPSTALGLMSPRHGRGKRNELLAVGRRGSLGSLPISQRCDEDPWLGSRYQQVSFVMLPGGRGRVKARIRKSYPPWQRGCFAFRSEQARDKLPVRPKIAARPKRIALHSGAGL